MVVFFLLVASNFELLAENLVFLEIEEIEVLVAAGRPVLVGTTTVEISELVSRMLQMKKIQHQVLNAKYHQKEAEIVANAGLPSR